MNRLGLVSWGWMLLSAMTCMAELQPLPISGVTAISFSLANGGTAVVSDSGNLGHVAFATIQHGKVVPDDTGESFDWTLAADEAFGKGRLDISLHRERLLGDLALVLNADFTQQSSIAVQLYDAKGAALALDLFGEIVANAEEVGTDTFIVPLVRYPKATRLVLRRLSGEVLIREVLLMPVLAEKETAGEADRDLAERLGERLSEFHRLTERAEKLAVGKIHRIPGLVEINAVGASALTAAGYPVYKPLGIVTEDVTYAPVSGTTYEFAKLANRMLSLEDDKPLFELFFTSSSGVHWSLSETATNPETDIQKKAVFGMTSVPMSNRAKQKYLEKTGHAIIEFPIARSAIEVLVHDTNPLDSISAQGLKAAFGAAGTAEIWKDLGVQHGALADQPVRTIGGNSAWGTGRMFQEIALGGDAWRPDIDAKHDVVYSWGVEEEVGNMPNAIGYAVQGPRKHPVKTLSLEATDGSGPTLATEDAIYSGRYPLQRRLYAVVAAASLESVPPAVREMVNLLLSDEGQSLMVRTRSLPLAATEVVEWRNRLGL